MLRKIVRIAILIAPVLTTPATAVEHPAASRAGTASGHSVSAKFKPARLVRTADTEQTQDALLHALSPNALGIVFGLLLLSIFAQSIALRTRKLIPVSAAWPLSRSLRKPPWRHSGVPTTD